MLHRRFGVELILDTSYHEVGVQGSIADLGGILDTDLLASTVTVRYHFVAVAGFGVGRRF